MTSRSHELARDIERGFRALSQSRKVLKKKLASSERLLKMKLSGRTRVRKASKSRRDMSFGEVKRQFTRSVERLKHNIQTYRESSEGRILRELSQEDDPVLREAWWLDGHRQVATRRLADTHDGALFVSAHQGTVSHLPMTAEPSPTDASKSSSVETASPKQLVHGAAQETDERVRREAEEIIARYEPPTTPNSPTSQAQEPEAPPEDNERPAFLGSFGLAVTVPKDDEESPEYTCVAALQSPSTQARKLMERRKFDRRSSDAIRAEAAEKLGLPPPKKKEKVKKRASELDKRKVWPFRYPQFVKINKHLTRSRETLLKQYPKMTRRLHPRAYHRLAHRQYRVYLKEQGRDGAAAPPGLPKVDQEVRAYAARHPHGGKPPPALKPLPPPHQMNLFHSASPRAVVVSDPPPRCTPVFPQGPGEAERKLAQELELTREEREAQGHSPSSPVGSPSAESDPQEQDEKDEAGLVQNAQPVYSMQKPEDPRGVFLVQEHTRDGAELRGSKAYYAHTEGGADPAFHKLWLISLRVGPHGVRAMRKTRDLLRIKGAVVAHHSAQQSQRWRTEREEWGTQARKTARKWQRKAHSARRRALKKIANKQSVDEENSAAPSASSSSRDSATSVPPPQRARSATRRRVIRERRRERIQQTFERLGRDSTVPNVVGDVPRGSYGDSSDHEKERAERGLQRCREFRWRDAMGLVDEPPSEHPTNIYEHRRELSDDTKAKRPDPLDVRGAAAAAAQDLARIAGSPRRVLHREISRAAVETPPLPTDAQPHPTIELRDESDTTATAPSATDVPTVDGLRHIFETMRRRNKSALSRRGSSASGSANTSRRGSLTYHRSPMTADSREGGSQVTTSAISAYAGLLQRTDTTNKADSSPARRRTKTPKQGGHARKYSAKSIDVMTRQAAFRHADLPVALPTQLTTEQWRREGDTVHDMVV